MPKETFIIFYIVYYIWINHHYVHKNPDLSNKVDSVDCKAVECALLLCELAKNPSFAQASKQFDANRPSAVILPHTFKYAVWLTNISK